MELLIGCWAWGDPSHKRIINDGTLAFLSAHLHADRKGQRGSLEPVETDRIGA